MKNFNLAGIFMLCCMITFSACSKNDDDHYLTEEDVEIDWFTGKTDTIPTPIVNILKTGHSGVFYGPDNTYEADISTLVPFLHYDGPYKCSIVYLDTINGYFNKVKDIHYYVLYTGDNYDGNGYIVPDCDWRLHTNYESLDFYLNYRHCISGRYITIWTNDCESISAEEVENYDLIYGVLQPSETYYNTFYGSTDFTGSQVKSGQTIIYYISNYDEQPIYATVKNGTGYWTAIASGEYKYTFTVGVVTSDDCCEVKFYKEDNSSWTLSYDCVGTNGGTNTGGGTTGGGTTGGGGSGTLSGYDYVGTTTVYRLSINTVYGTKSYQKATLSASGTYYKYKKSGSYYVTSYRNPSSSSDLYKLNRNTTTSEGTGEGKISVSAYSYYFYKNSTKYYCK